MISTKEYINKIHYQSKGYITKSCISKKNNKYSQFHYSSKNLIKQDFTGENKYMSLNTFYKPQRRMENIKELNALYIDLDVYNSTMFDFTPTPEQIEMLLHEEYFGNGNNIIPAPTFVINSGRGLYLIWKIQPVPIMALPLWKAIQEFLYDKLKDLGADRKALDPTRILRVPGSINSKSNTQVEVLVNNNLTYTLREIQRDYLPQLEENKQKGRPTKIHKIYTERSLYFKRLQDLLKLCELRNYDLRGNREYILFLYRYYTCYFTDDTEKALNDIIELNNRFTYPLKQREVIRATKSAETAYKKDKQYKYKNKTLVEVLNITEWEQQQLDTIIDSKESKIRKSKQNKEYYQNELKSNNKKPKQEQIEDRQKKVLNLLEQGLKRKEICDILNMSFKTYERYLKVLKEKSFT